MLVVFCMDTLEYDTIHNVDHHVMHTPTWGVVFFVDDVEVCLSSGSWDLRELKETRSQMEKQKSIQNSPLASQTQTLSSAKRRLKRSIDNAWQL